MSDPVDKNSEEWKAYSAHLDEVFDDVDAERKKKKKRTPNGHDAQAGKVRLAAIRPDAEAGPVMELLDNLLSSVDARRAPYARRRRLASRNTMPRDRRVA